MNPLTGEDATALRAAAQARLHAAQESDPEGWREALADERVASTLARVWACSEFVACSCLRDPAMLAELTSGGALFTRSERDGVAAELQALARGADEAQCLHVLRRFRRKHTVRIAWRDIAGWADLDETLRDLSALADVCVQFAYASAYEALTARYGAPRGEQTREPQPLMILAMGKLGGAELNFSSDIDLILLYPEAGETDGPRTIDNAEFFLRLGQKIVQLLSHPTVDGFVYRVDLRLRPFGESGRLAVSFGAFEDYLQQHGRDWERYAYVKARPLTALEHYSALYDNVLRPFVYRRYLDFRVFESLREMKAMIAREVERGELQDNIKLGPGGIREIEFIVQAFQLIRGGGDPRLQRRELLAVLPLLAGHRLLKEKAVQDLQSAYRFLRVVENRLQQWNDEQTHELPDDAVGRARLAYAMNLPDWNALDQQLREHRARVARHFEQTLFGPRMGGEDEYAGSGLFDLEASRAELAQSLRQLGFEDADGGAEQLDQLRASAYYRRLDETGRRRVRELLPRLLPAIARSDSPLVALARIIRILERIGGRTVYLALLNENGPARRRLVQLCAQSAFLAEQIAAHPLLLDELIDERLVEEPPTRAQFAEELAARRTAMQTEEPDRQVEILRQFQNAATFRVAVADLACGLPLMKVSDRLTDIAELIVEQALELAWVQMIERYGEPHCVDADGRERRAGMIVVAYGKLGGLELGYGSDLDLVFLHETGAASPEGDTTHIENSAFFQRLGQRLVHLLTVHTSAGRLYEVDTRLRPGGNRGLLVQSLDAFRQYEFAEAWTWEHQSLLRARAIAGPEPLREKFEAARIEVLRKAVRREGLREEVRNMRERMRSNLSRARAGQFDIKQDSGGVADLEFLVQYWMLKWADRYPEIVTFPDNIRQLESLASGGLVPQSRVDFLVNTYRKYRQRLHRLSLDGARNIVPADEFVEERRGVIAVWDEVMAEAPEARSR